MKKPRLATAAQGLLALALSIPAVPASAMLTDPLTVFTVPAFSKPAYLASIVDPTFQSTVTRLGNNIGSSTTPVSGTWGSDARHVYSKQQPWNSDQTLITTENRSGGSPTPMILDGTTYAPRYAPCGNYGPWDYRWHPSPAHSHEQINVNSSGTELMWFDVTTCTKTRSWTLPIAVDYGIGSGEGNPSNDGRFVALGSATRMFVVDMDPQPPFAAYPNRRIGPTLDISSCGLSSGCAIDWVSISASGKYAVVNYDGDHPRVFDVDPNTLALSPHPEQTAAPRCSGSASAGYIYDLGHADFALNPFDGNADVLVGQEGCGNAGSTVGGKLIGYVVMVRLSDGAITPLTSPSNEAYPDHVSTRNIGWPGWAFVSHYDEPGKRFSDEIIAVKLDGSLACQRLAHSHTAFSGCYRCEAHPAPSPDGQRVIFASNWAQDCGGGCGSSSDIKDYVVSNPHLVDAGPAATPPSDSRLALDRVSPNPAVASFRVSFTLAGAGVASLDLFDIVGRRVTHRDLGALGPGPHEAMLRPDAGLPPGIYSMRLVEAGRDVVARVVLMR